MQRPPGTLPALLLAGPLLLAGCGSDAAPGGDPDAAEATPPSLAAAVVAHYDEPLVAAVALLPSESDRLLSADTLAAELAFDSAEGDNTHVEVVVLPHDALDDDSSFSNCSIFTCEDISTEGVEATLVYENGNPEEDPGRVAALADWGDRLVLVTAYGPLVPLDGDELEQDAEVIALGEAVAQTVTDPAVGFRTSAEYVDAGEEICAGDEWLDWYGQGNGYPEPDDNVDHC